MVLVMSGEGTWTCHSSGATVASPGVAWRLWEIGDPCVRESRFGSAARATTILRKVRLRNDVVGIRP